MKHKLSIILVILFIVGCASIDLSTPEKNYETQYTAIKAKNFKMFAQCFADAEPYTEDNLRTLADMAFNKIKVVSHRIITKEKTGEKEALIMAEETSERKEGRTKTIFRINYIESGGIWKIASSEIISFEKDTTKSKQ
jgi:PBP1b-binding outer membrane lipoprotein LpoB